MLYRDAIDWLLRNWQFAIYGILILAFLFKKVNNYFDFREIIINHLRLFKTSPAQYMLYYGIPALLAWGTVNKRTIDEVVINNVNIVITILLSVLFATLSTIAPLHGSEKEFEPLKAETINAIMFESLLCVFTLVLSFVVIFSSGFGRTIFCIIVSWLIYYFVYVIVLQLLIVFKRLSKLLQHAN